MNGRRLDLKSPLPRYYQIYSALLSMIQLGELAVGEPLPPERSIAEAFGVARPTVVKALDLLEREGLIEKQQGRGSFVLEPREGDKTYRTLAFISSLSLTADLLMGVSQMAFEHNYQLQVVGIDAEFKQLDVYLQACVDNGVEGFLIYGRAGAADAPIYRKLLTRGIPVVMVDRYYPELACDHVVYNNEAASFELTQRLIDRGHQKLAIVPGFDLETTAVQDRLSGYRSALEASGLEYDEDLVWLDLYNKRSPSGVVNESFQASLREYLETYRPTALITINNLIADRVMHDLLVLQHSRMHSASKGSLDISAFELELATFDDRFHSEPSYLSVVAVHPTVQLGRAAAKRLIERLEGSPTTEIKHLTLSMDIVECSGQAKELAVERRR